MGRRCCCQKSCLLLLDEFNRDDSTNLGSDWNEVSGNWSIDSNKLKEAGNSGALVWSTTVPTEAEVVVEVQAQDTYPTTPGRKYRVIILGIDADNYFYGQINADATTYKLIVGSRTSGVDTELETWTSSSPLGADAKMCVAFNGAMVSLVTGEGSGDGVWACASDNGGRDVGLANWDTQTILWDRFAIWRHWVNDSSCPYCMCSCDEECTPKDIVLTFSATGDCNAKLDGETISLSRDEGDGYLPQWTDGKYVCSCAWCTSHYWDVFLECARDRTDWRLNKYGPTGTDQCTTPEWDATPASGYNLAAHPSSVTCDPFSMVFGPFTIPAGALAGSCDCCSSADDTAPSGTYTITVTEAP